MFQRKNLLLTYTTPPAACSSVLTGAPWDEHVLPGYQRAGVNLAAHTMIALRIPEVIERTRQAPYPRLCALLDLLAQAPEDDSGEDWIFHLPGSDGVVRPFRLDEVPLPAGTPAAA
jgi:hypothetical protein